MNPDQALSLIAIHPRSDSIGPPGIHLRWHFAPQLGFPPAGFQLYRRKSKENRTFLCLGKFAEPMTFPLEANGWVAYAEESLVVSVDQGQLVVEKPGKIQLFFVEPVVRVQVRTGAGVPSPTLRAYAGKRLTAKTRDNGTALSEISAPLITAVEMDLEHGMQIADICHQPKAALCQANWGSPIAKLSLPTNVDAALKRLEPRLRNRYASSQQDAQKKYGSETAHLIDRLKQLQSPDAATFVDPNVTPDQLRMRLNDDPATPLDTPLNDLQPQSILLLSALDPNIARMLSLYWVDRFRRFGDPAPNQSYDYKVEARWGNTQYCALALDVGDTVAELPVVGTPGKPEQLPGIHWRNGQPHARVRLGWQMQQPADPTLQVTRPVCYDLVRTNITLGTAAQRLTDHKPILATREANGDTLSIQHVDPRVPIGSTEVLVSGNLALFEHRYAVSGIDIFGQIRPVTRDSDAPDAESGCTAAARTPTRRDQPAGASLAWPGLACVAQ